MTRGAFGWLLHACLGVDRYPRIGFVELRVVSLPVEIYDAIVEHTDAKRRSVVQGSASGIGASGNNRSLA